MVRVWRGMVDFLMTAGALLYFPVFALVCIALTILGKGNVGDGVDVEVSR